jgi:hypothetical protein
MHLPLQAIFKEVLAKYGDKVSLAYRDAVGSEKMPTAGFGCLQRRLFRQE